MFDIKPGVLNLFYHVHTQRVQIFSTFESQNPDDIEALGDILMFYRVQSFLMIQTEPLTFSNGPPVKKL